MDFHAGNHDIEIVECTGGGKARRAAFGSVRIDIVEACKLRRILEFAEHRDPVTPVPLGSGLGGKPTWPNREMGDSRRGDRGRGRPQEGSTRCRHGVIPLRMWRLTKGTGVHTATR